MELIWVGGVQHHAYDEDWAKSSDVLRDIARRLKLSTEVLDTLDFSRWDSQK